MKKIFNNNFIITVDSDAIKNQKQQ